MKNVIIHNITRRNFLKKTGILAASATILGCKETKSTQQKRYAMVIDLEKCIGCHSCSISCKTQFDVPLGVFRSWVKIIERGSYPAVKRIFIPVLCNHCDDPPCVKGCPTGATYQRADGIVVVNPDDCIGCKYCIQNCPYNARFLHPITKTASKCDFCLHRIKQGITPSCVNTCIGQARTFGDYNDPQSSISQILLQNNSQVLLEAMGTNPRVFYINLDQNAYTTGKTLLWHNDFIRLHD
ncbi:MAG: 4Fe-4S dicluster domain-containing protein [Nitrospirae bacterium]|nr:4Fe-4S dicluster domain-containing protein [Nitrospirota bacterium]